MQNETTSSSQQPQPQHQSKRKAYDPWQQLAAQDGKTAALAALVVASAASPLEATGQYQQQDQGSNRSSSALAFDDMVPIFICSCLPGRLAAAAAARPHTPAGHRRSDCAARRCGLQLQRAVDAVLAAGLSACGRRLVASARARSSDKSRGSRSVMLGTRHRASVAKRAQGRSRMHQSEPLRQYASRILASPSLLKTKKKFILTHKYDSMSF